MPTSPADINVPQISSQEAEARIAPFLGLPCWGVNWFRTTGLSMNFGQPHLVTYEPRKTKSNSVAVRRSLAYRKVFPRGEWWFWVNTQRWKLAIPGELTVTHSSSERRISIAAEGLLDGQRLKSVAIHPRTGRTRIEFDLGAVLDIRRRSADDDFDLWSLYEPSTFVSVDGRGVCRMAPLEEDDD
jgi:hypothetical protein